MRETHLFYWIHSIRCIQVCVSQTSDTCSLCYVFSFLTHEESKIHESRSFRNVSQKERGLLIHYTMLSSSWLCVCNWSLSSLPLLDIRLLTKCSAVLCPAWNPKHVWVSTSNSWLLFPPNAMLLFIFPGMTRRFLGHRNHWEQTIYIQHRTRKHTSMFYALLSISFIPEYFWWVEKLLANLENDKDTICPSQL